MAAVRKVLVVKVMLVMELQILAVAVAVAVQAVRGRFDMVALEAQVLS